MSTVTTGIWSIIKYTDSGTDKTADYEGYSFVFNGSGALTATSGTAINPGTWGVTDSDSSEDNLEDLHFNIVFAAPPLLVELTDDWIIIEVTSTSLKLADVSGGGSGADYLTLFKN